MREGPFQEMLRLNSSMHDRDVVDHRQRAYRKLSKHWGLIGTLYQGQFQVGSYQVGTPI